LTAARAHLVNDDGRITIGDRSVIVADPAMAKTYELLQKLAASDIAVLVVGETGAGKEMAAYAIHACSRRAAAPLIAVNCAALPETLIESELFGHEKGAFSGADRTKPGLIERAAGGTLFLDELLELPPPAQAKLLRALEERAVHRVGGLAPISVDFRLVAATNRDVATEVAAGRLREDLYYRVAGAVVELPPLRDRPRDITVLARAFLERACERANKPRRVFSDGALRALGSYRFPGNVRELANAIEFACATSGDDVVEAWHLPAAITQADAAVADAAASPRAFRPIDEEIAELERRRMTEALEATDGNQSRAADLIGMPRRTFVTKATRYGLRRTGSRR
jgi:DNA-binding NtrC family response regulator